MSDPPASDRRSWPEHDRAVLRASDLDREQTASSLRRAASEGRLFAEELEQRLEAAFTATTCGQLERLVSDLPGDREPNRRPVVPLRARIAVALAVALLVASVLLAGAARIGVGRSSAAAAHQPRARANAQVEPP